MPLVWIPSNDYRLIAVNALTDDLVINMPLIVRGEEKSISGSFGLYDQTTPSLVVDQKDGIVIFGSSGSEATNSGRGFFVGLNVNNDPPTILWRTFMIPPQDGSDPSWSINSVNSLQHAYIFDGQKAIDLKALPASPLRDMLYADWGNFGFNGTRSFAGADPGWGGSWEWDNQTGIAYVSTAEPAPDYNATTRPGPNLWSDSIIAMDPTTGRFIWAFQTTPHDMWDWDCSWGVSIANINIGGTLKRAVFKGCKNEFLYALDAATGSLLWALQPSGTRYTQHFGANGSPLTDPTNMQTMTRPDICCPKKTCIQFPGGGGALESDLAVDPVKQMVFLGAYNNGGPIHIFDAEPPFNGCKLNPPGSLAYLDSCGWNNDIGSDVFPGP